MISITKENSCQDPHVYAIRQAGCHCIQRLYPTWPNKYEFSRSIHWKQIDGGHTCLIMVPEEYQCFDKKHGGYETPFPPLIHSLTILILKMIHSRRNALGRFVFPFHECPICSPAGLIRECTTFILREVLQLLYYQNAIEGAKPDSKAF